MKSIHINAVRIGLRKLEESDSAADASKALNTIYSAMLDSKGIEPNRILEESIKILGKASVPKKSNIYYLVRSKILGDVDRLLRADSAPK